MRLEAYKIVEQIPTISPMGVYLGSIARTHARVPRRRHPALGYLGQATAGGVSVAAAIAQANPSHKSPDDTTMTTAVQGEQLTPGYNTPSECAQAGKGVGTAAKVEAAGALAVAKIAPLTGPAAPFVAAGAAVLSLISAITGHHGQAVANEQAVLCQSVPATNQALQAVIAAVQGGSMSPSDGIAALGQIQSAFNAAVKPITKSCNEACGLSKELAAIVYYLSGQFQAMPASAVASTGAFGSSIGSLFSGLPTWALIGGAALAAFVLLGD